MISWPVIVQANKAEMIQSLQDYIKIPSVSALPVCNKAVSRNDIVSGQGPLKALDYLLELGSKMGFAAANIGNLGGIIEYGKSPSAIGIAIHADTVPAGEGWTVSPFEGLIKDQKIYGRGAIDNKGPGIAVLYGLKAVKESGFNLNKKIQIIIGLDEEIIWDCTAKMLHQIKQPDFTFIPDGDFPLINAEKGLIWAEFERTFECNAQMNTRPGIILKHLKGGKSFNVVPDYCEALVEVDRDYQPEFISLLQTLTAKKGYSLEIHPDYSPDKAKSSYILISRGKSVHASNCEQGLNAISQLMMYLNKILLKNSSHKAFVDFYSKNIGMNCYGETLGLFFEDDVSGKLTINPAIIEMDSASVMLKFDIRFPAKASLDDIQNAFINSLQPLNGNLKIVDSLNSHYVSPDNENIQKLLQVYASFTGEHGVVPLSIGGTTFAKAFRNAVAFGPLFQGMPKVEHNPDEYMEIDHLVKCAEIYAQAIYELAKN